MLTEPLYPVPVAESHTHSLNVTDPGGAGSVAELAVQTKDEDRPVPASHDQQNIGVPIAEAKFTTTSTCPDAAVTAVPPV